MKYNLFISICLALLCCTACTQRITADVSSRVEEGYSPSGQSVSIGTLPSVDEGQIIPQELEQRLKTALMEKGYTINDGVEPADVHVRLYWQSFGPYITIKENPLWDFDMGRRGPWSRDRYIKEEKHLRTLIMEAWANKFSAEEQANQITNKQKLAPFLQKPLSYKEAIAYMPKEPARLLWRVETKSMGNLSRADRVLGELLESALPWIARSVSVRILVQGDDTGIIHDERDSIMPY